MLSPGRQILMEEEVITPPRGSSDCKKSGFTTEGGPSGPEPQGSPRGVRAVPTFLRRAVHEIVV